MSRLDCVIDFETAPIAPTAETLTAMRSELFSSVINWQPPGNIKKQETIEAKRAEFEASVMGLTDEQLTAKYYEDNAFNLPLLDIVSWCLVVCENGQIRDVYSDARREAVLTFAEAWNNLEQKLSPRLVGYNSKDFDVPVLLINLMRHGLALKPRISNSYDGHLDLRGTICGFKGRGTLKSLTNNFGIDEYVEGENGSMVLPLLLEGKLAEIEKYCRKDTEATAELFLRLSKILGI